jgi:hypothetical protein
MDFGPNIHCCAEEALMNDSNRVVVLRDTVPVALKLGQNAPEFDMNTYDPVTGDFGHVSLADQIGRQRWTILFFYPADFTFV